MRLNVERNTAGEMYEQFSDDSNVEILANNLVGRIKISRHVAKSVTKSRRNANSFRPFRTFTVI